MNTEFKTFKNAFQEKEVIFEDIDSWIDNWHQTETSMTLDEYLGFTEEGGSLFARDPNKMKEKLVKESLKNKG